MTTDTYTIQLNGRPAIRMEATSILRALVDFIDEYECEEWGRFLSVSGHSQDVLAVYEHTEVQVWPMVGVVA